MRESRLRQGGANLFQEIKEVCKKAEAAGQELYRLSIGQPTGPALESARQASSEAVLSDKESMHEYQDNGTPGIPDFARRFIQCHVKSDLAKHGDEVVCLPIPGIKPMLGLVQLACGPERLVVDASGYPTPGDQAEYLLYPHTILPLSKENNFLVNSKWIKTFERSVYGFAGMLVMMNYPHNPSGQIMTRIRLEDLCGFCQDYSIRIFNDAAYAILAHSEQHCTLTDVAVYFPDLSWAEAFSASKAGNFTGWRIGAMAGSPDFIGDIAKIKGNTDSGLAAPLAAGVIHTFENDREGIENVRRTYEFRLGMLIDCLTKHGMKLAVEPGAGFFTLWQTPKHAFSQTIESAEQFNYLMIKKTGIVGVHFEPYVRYAVCGPIEEWLGHIERSFTEARISY
ncbi:aminotransferase class I/II-fold pyridoxal phosphate-dependent enzyme [Candidatus Falkowbacteria bacterium]|nr:aminotransferase class I/II-fold pyridoxal phosphate-dependent enzyme [Candidatus Falkowbacteria bacterium]